MAPSRPQTCPFCGAVGGLMKEHVWPKWLRVAPTAKWLLETSPRGRRSPHLEPVVVLDADGVYRSETELVSHVQNLLPEVTVPVCGPCNNGWMNELEGKAQTILLPFLTQMQPIVAVGVQKEARRPRSRRARPARGRRARF